MKFAVLGPFEMRAGGAVIAVGRKQERCLVGLLLLEAGHVVGYGRLADLLWDGQPPAGARAAVHTYVARLRSALRPYGVQIFGSATGYRIDVDPQAVDVHRFRSAILGARSIRDMTLRAETLRGALALWRGPVLEGVGSPWLQTRVGADFDELRMTAIAMLAESELATGRADQAVDVLRPVAMTQPLREHLVGLLMAAYVATGRQSAAVALYHEARAVLVDTLGLEPGPLLRRRYAELLAGETATEATPTVRKGSAVAQLPADIRAFTGRGPELERLDAIAGGTADRATAAVVLSIFGMGGIGKTALAVHWAHRVRPDYPDGQLYVNLRGFDARAAPVRPASALRGFLDALGEEPARMPADLDLLAGRYRTLLAGRHMIILLDDAHDSEQVRHLLPGAPGCMTLVTSRNQLPALVALAGSHVLTVEPLPAEDARGMLRARAGAARVGDEPGPVDEIVAWCGGLPLALSIVAAQTAMRPGMTFADLAGRLSRTGGALDAVDAGEPAADVRSVLWLSYRSLRAATAELFRLLGLHPSPAFDLHAAASLAAIPVSDAGRMLGELVTASLVTNHVAGQYGMHDLVHAYAGELVRIDSDEARQDAQHRLRDHLLHTALAADRLIEPSRHPTALDEPAADVSVTPHAGVAEAMEWFAASHSTLMTCLCRSSEAGDHASVRGLASVMATFLDRSSNWADLETSQNAALAAGRALGLPATRVAAHHALARADIRRNHLDGAMEHLSAALALLDQPEDVSAVVSMHNEIATLHAARGDNRQALAYVQRAVELQKDLDDPALLARSMNGVGWFHAQLGEYEQALICCQQALAIIQEYGDKFGEADTWDSIGFINHHQGKHARAKECYLRAVDLFRSVGDQYQAALTLDHIGDAARADGDPTGARAAWRQSLELLDQIGHDHADLVRAKLTEAI